MPLSTFFCLGLTFSSLGLSHQLGPSLISAKRGSSAPSKRQKALCLLADPKCFPASPAGYQRKKNDFRKQKQNGQNTYFRKQKKHTHTKSTYFKRFRFGRPTFPSGPSRLRRGSSANCISGVKWRCHPNWDQVGEWVDFSFYQPVFCFKVPFFDPQPNTEQSLLGCFGMVPPFLTLS